MTYDITYIVTIAGQPVSVASADAIQAWLAPYEIQLDSTKIHLVQKYIGLLVFWNQRINLTSITEQEEIVTRHFGESFYFSRVVPAEKGRLADIGSGAGFPGLALKILLNELQVFLIEQDTRKSTFLHEVVRLLDLRSATVCRVPFESLAPEVGNFDFIASRAVGGHKHLLKWARGRLNAHGQVALWLGSEEAARIQALKGWRWPIIHAIPHSKRRVLIIGQPE